MKSLLFENVQFFKNLYTEKNPARAVLDSSIHLYQVINQAYNSSAECQIFFCLYLTYSTV